MEKKSVIRSVEDLDVYRKAYALALEVHKFTLGLPKIEQYALGDQMRRASKSVCANLAEGFARQRASSAEFHRFLMMAVSSGDEMRVWLRFCRDLGYLCEETAKEWRQNYAEIARMLNGLKNKWQ